MGKIGCYEIKQAKDGQYHFNLKASNREIILSSELYTTKTACKNGIASVQKNCTDKELFEERQSSNGKPYFVLKAKNHQEIGRSEMYESEAACHNGMVSVMINGVTTDIRDKCDDEPAQQEDEFFRIVKGGDGLYCIGFDAPDGRWMQHSAYTDSLYASEKCRELNAKAKAKRYK